MSKNNNKSKGPQKLSKRERTRISIMHSAKVLFEKYGIEDVTFQMIADGAGMCRTTVFNHFNGTKDLTLALTTQEIEDLREVCEENDLKGIDLIYGLYDRLIEDTANYPALATTLINSAIISRDEENPVRIVEELTERGLREAGIEDPEKKAILTEGIYYGLINHYHVNNMEFRREEIKERFHRLFESTVGGK